MKQPAKITIEESPSTTLFGLVSALSVLSLSSINRLVETDGEREEKLREQKMKSK